MPILPFQDTDDLLNSDTGDKRSHSLPAKILAKIKTKFSPKNIISGTLAAIAIAASSAICSPTPAHADPVIASGSYGCATFRHYQAWWGQYTYLNKCAAEQVAGVYGVFNGVAGTLASKVPAQYRIPVSLTNLYNRSLASNLRSCAARNGQAYLRLYRVPSWPISVVPYVSCT